MHKMLISGMIIILLTLGACTTTAHMSPPAARVEVRPAPPSPGFVWIQGHWKLRHGKWVWVSGYWVKRPGPKAVWVQGHWKKTPRGLKWIPGHWRR